MVLFAYPLDVIVTPLLGYNTTTRKCRQSVWVLFTATPERTFSYSCGCETQRLGYFMARYQPVGEHVSFPTLNMILTGTVANRGCTTHRPPRAFLVW